MAEKLPVIEFGDELAIVFPDHLLAKMALGIGDTVWLVEKPGALELHSKPPPARAPIE